jgi:hypothetical protein
MSAYATPVAFRRSVDGQAKGSCEEQLLAATAAAAAVAYDRLVERLYLMDDGWIIKGAVALLARDLGVRASIDIGGGELGPKSLGARVERAQASAPS